MSKQPIGVILLNLGGPERLSDVEPFLYNLFSDRKIIRLGPSFLQKPIARFIAWRRAPKSKKSYELIGGGSPLKKLTRQQGEGLAAELAGHADFKVDMAMRYWPPYAGEVLAQMALAGISRIIALTLYPHYSKATTGSSLDDLREMADKSGADFEIVAIEEWPEQPDYIKALAATITEGLADWAEDDIELLYSAHSLPVKFIEEGDPYLDHLQKTIAAVEKITGVKGRLCFQSRSGPVEWLAPSTPDTMAEIAGQGCRRALAVPLSFVSDHVETLYELDIQYRDLAADLGLELRRTKSLNIRPDFIKGLSSLVLAESRLRGWRPL